MKTFRKLSILVSGILLVLAMGACDQMAEPTNSQLTTAESVLEPNAQSATGVDLEGTVWDLISIAGINASGNGVFLEFSKGRVTGSDGCNEFSTSFWLEDGTIILGNTFTSTLVLCQSSFSNLSSQFQDMLREKGAIFSQNGKLIIQTDHGELVFEAPQSAPLANSKWVLNSIRNQQGLVSMDTDQNILFSIVNDKVSGDGGCNIFGGNVKIDGAKAHFSEIFAMENSCDNYQVNELEAEFFAILENTASYEIMRQSLTFFDEKDEIIATFRTTDILSEAITLFVGPQQVDCEGVMPQKCFLIRKSPNDDYTYLYDSIIGFEWEAGYEYELLVKVSEVDSPPADGSSLLYELIEIVKKTPVKKQV